MPPPAKPLPPLDTLSELFSYDPVTGFITNRVSRTTRRAGARAESPSGEYLVVSYQGELFLAHRVAWKLHYGEEPPPYMDHRNRKKHENWIGNLRPATHPQNMRNTGVRSDSVSGVKGVRWAEDRQRWRATITVDGKRISLGHFDTRTEAEEAMKKAREKLHGAFSCSL